MRRGRLEAYLTPMSLVVGMPMAWDCIISASCHVIRERSSILHLSLTISFRLWSAKTSLGCVGAGWGLLTVEFPLRRYLGRYLWVKSPRISFGLSGVCGFLGGLKVTMRWYNHIWGHLSLYTLHFSSAPPLRFLDKPVLIDWNVWVCKININLSDKNFIPPCFLLKTLTNKFIHLVTISYTSKNRHSVGLGIPWQRITRFI